MLSHSTHRRVLDEAGEEIDMVRVCYCPTLILLRTSQRLMLYECNQLDKICFLLLSLSLSLHIHELLSPLSVYIIVPVLLTFSLYFSAFTVSPLHELSGGLLVQEEVVWTGSQLETSCTEGCENPTHHHLAQHTG